MAKRIIPQRFWKAAAIGGECTGGDTAEQYDGDSDSYDDSCDRAIERKMCNARISFIDASDAVWVVALWEE